MFKAIVGIYLAIVGLAAYEAASTPESKELLVLNAANFEKVLAEHENILVEFYVPSCKNCVSLDPRYSAAAQVLKTHRLFLGKIDASVEKELAKKFKVQEFPTLKLFTKGKPIDYTGKIDPLEIVLWMKKRFLPPTEALKSSYELDMFTLKNTVALVYFGAPIGAEFKTYELVAKQFEKIHFGYCAVQECRDSEKAAVGSIVLYKKFDEKRNNYTDVIEEQKLIDFIEVNSEPFVVNFDKKTAELIFQKSTPGLFLYRDSDDKNSTKVEKIFVDTCKKLKKKIKGVVAGIKTGLGPKLAISMGITYSELPTVRIHDTSGELKKYKMEGNITEENILKFVDDWKNNRLKPRYKSQDIPEQKENVYVLVGKSFEQIALDPTKDVLVEFYSPYCEPCEKVAPIYDELAKKLKHNKNLIIAKMDETMNETEHAFIKGYPTFKFWPAKNSKTAVDFTGEITLNGFVGFLKKKCVNPITDTKTKEGL